MLRSIHIFDRPKIRGLFHWNYSGWWIAILWGSGLAMLGIALALESVRLPIWPAIVLSYVLFGAAMLWSLGYWLTSDTVIQLDPASWSRQRRKKAKGHCWLKYRFAKWMIAILISGIFIGAMWATSQTNYQIELSGLGGILIPAFNPTPGICGTLPPLGVVLQYGYNGSVIRSFPHLVVSSRRFGSVLALDRSKEGYIVVKLDIRSSDNKIIAQLGKDGFIVNEHNYLKIKRADKSSLIVVDEYGDEVLNIRYLNPQAIRVDGILRFPGRAPMPFKQLGMTGICTDTNNIPGVWDLEIP